VAITRFQPGALLRGERLKIVNADQVRILVDTETKGVPLSIRVSHLDTAIGPHLLL
jgi:hypothetical protein